MPDPIQFLLADLDNPAHQSAVLTLIDAYSRDPMGDGRPLTTGVRERLIPGLRQHPTTLIVLAFDGELPVGVAVCFLGFSTFPPARWSICMMSLCCPPIVALALAAACWKRSKYAHASLAVAN